MGLSPILVIGCGGSGGKVVLGLRRRLEEDLRRRGWDHGIPAAWQLKWIDVPAKAENHQEFGPPLPLGDYVALAPHDAYGLIDSALVTRAASSVSRLVGWRPTPNLALPVSKGAGQMRAVGRSVALANSARITGMVTSAFTQMAAGEAELANISRLLNASPDVSRSPTVFVVTSMAGGTGAGIFMDVCDVVRAMRPEVSNQIFGFLFTAEIFTDVGAGGGMAPNTVASLSELISGYLSVNRQAEPLFGAIGPVGVAGKSGPSWPFVIGMQPMGGGAPLESPSQCYRAVTDTILASMTNERFMQSFVNYQVTNFGPNSNAEKRMTAYQMMNQSPAEGDMVQACGIVSSFGSAVVSVGSAKFAEWGRDRLARSVLDHVLSGWRDHGRQLMGELATAAVTDADVVDFLVQRDRLQFIARCGLHEEDEPNGVEHNDVLEAITPLTSLSAARSAFRGSLLNELSKAVDTDASGWQRLIQDLVPLRAASFRGEAEKILSEGFERYAPRVLENISAALSEWLAHFGVAVTQGLLRELREQCRAAVSQLQSEIHEFKQRALQPTSAHILHSFSSIGTNRCGWDSRYVGEALEQALGPLVWNAMVRRHEIAAELLTRAMDRVLSPVMAQIEAVGALLVDAEATAMRLSWPDAGGGVSDIYAPSPTEKVLLSPTGWDAQYERLLTLAAGSIQGARDEIAAGGFNFGPVVRQESAQRMVSFGASTRWWDRDGGIVDVRISLRPDDIVRRAQQWLWNENHAAGRFVRMGLGEYLSEEPQHKAARLRSFEEALINARQLAQPLVRINTTLMQLVHPGKESLDLQVACEQFPFPPAMVEAREVVERVLFGMTPPDGGWFMSGNTAGVESRLLTAVLTSAVQPATVTSLTEPIAHRWRQICSAPLEMRRDAISGFWTYNRARLITESIPLPAPSVHKIALGWFIGRLLGLVTDATAERGFEVHHHESGRDQASPLPWPLLNHRSVSDLHLRIYQTQWLPALLEHFGLASMLLGHDPRLLDGYEQLYRLGDRSTAILERWIVDGALPCRSGGKPQIGGADADERKTVAVDAIGKMRAGYEKQLAETLIIGDWDRFMEIPYGFELYPLFVETLNQLHVSVVRIETEQVYG